MGHANHDFFHTKRATAFDDLLHRGDQRLATIKADARLRDIPLVRQSRLSVMPIPRPAFDRILALGKTKLPRR